MSVKKRMITAVLVCVLALGNAGLGAGVGAAQPQQILTLVGQFGGATYAVTLSGTNAYAGIGPRLAVLDVQTPAAPVLLGISAPIPDLIQDIVVAGDYAYVTAGAHGLYIFDINPPATPTQVGAFDTPGFARGVDKLGQYVYVADSASVEIIDVTNPAVPAYAASLVRPAGTGVSEGVTIVNSGGSDYAVVADGEAGLQIYAITPPAWPWLSAVDTADYAMDVVAAMPYAYVANGGSGLAVADLTVIAAPDLVGALPILDIARSIAVRGAQVYVAMGDSGVSIVDVTDPTGPTELGVADTPGSALAVAAPAAGQNLFVADSALGLRAVNATNPAAPVEIGAYETLGTGRDIALAADGRYVYGAAGPQGLFEIDSLDRANLSLAGRAAIAGWSQSVALAGGYAFVADVNAALNVVDVNPPGAPTLAASLSLTDPVEDVVVDGAYAYLANGGIGLNIVDVSSPIAPAEVISVPVPSYAEGVAVAGGYAYVAAGADGLIIVDVSPVPGAITVGTWVSPTLPGYVEDVAVSGSYAYVVDGDIGLRIIDITNPAVPFQAGIYDTPGYASGVAVVGNLVLVADGLEGVHLIDIANPALPTLVDTFNTAGTAWHVAIGGALYVADMEGGVYALEYPLGLADLSIDKSDGATASVVGTPIVYTLHVDNSGPGDVAGAWVNDPLPAQLSAASWTCVAVGGTCAAPSGTGAISTTVDLRFGGRATFTLSATIASIGGGTLTNTATVSAPPGVTDTQPANNTATDVNTLTQPTADLAITKTDGLTVVMTGAPITYTIAVSNAGPSAVTGATVHDLLPAALQNATWTCAATGGACGTPAGSGSITATVDLQAGGQATFTLVATVDRLAQGTLSNTALVTAPAGTIDPPANNTATDTTDIAVSADLAMTKTDGSATATPGEVITYTIAVANAGPSPVTGATVSDLLPAALQNATWTCTATGGVCGTPAGSGNISATVDLQAGGHVTFTLVATIDGLARGTLSNTAQVTAPAGIVDPPANNTATDTTALVPQVNLTAQLLDAPDPLRVGQLLTYTLTVSNTGASTATGVMITDTLPAGLTFVAAPGCAFSAGTVTCDVGTVAGGATVARTITVTPTIWGTILNSASVDSTETAPVVVQATTTVTPYTVYLPAVFLNH